MSERAYSCGHSYEDGKPNCPVCEPKPNDGGAARSYFERCIERKLMKDGSLQILCGRGLWCVSGLDHIAVEREALHYWQQYFCDGEYSHLLLRSKEKEKG